ncbi:hypothetical protein IKG24_01965 [Candidatus Saccharibacteria bacterium]|nr:hypothetical protein [Candidatus Saccharibacteria bacterium]
MEKRLKRLIKIVLRGIAIALVATILVSYGQPIVTALAHDFPSDINDWSQYDWDKFYEYVRDHDRNWNRDRYYDPYYGCYRDYPVYYNYNYGNGTAYNNAYNYNSYNYYGGVLDVYDANTEGQAQILAKIINLYAHGVASQTGQACVGWAVMNSVDASSGGADIGAVAPNFHYDASRPTSDDFGRDLMPLARDIVFRWKAGRAGIGNNGRVLPGGYCWVWSTGDTLAFRNTPSESGAIWNYSSPSPYGS